MNDVKISIYDSIVQVLPNATKAVQNFNGDQFAEQILSKQEAAEDSSSDAESPEVDSPEARKLALYIGEECLPAFSLRFVTATTPQSLPWLSSLCSIKRPNSPRKSSSGVASSSSCCPSPPTSLLVEA